MINWPDYNMLFLIHFAGKKYLSTKKKYFLALPTL